MFTLIRLINNKLIVNGKPVPQTIWGIVMIPGGAALAWGALFGSEHYTYMALLGLIVTVLGFVVLIKGITGLASGQKGPQAAYPMQPYGSPAYPPYPQQPGGNYPPPQGYPQPGYPPAPQAYAQQGYPPNNYPGQQPYPQPGYPPVQQPGYPPVQQPDSPPASTGYSNYETPPHYY